MYREIIINEILKGGLHIFTGENVENPKIIRNEDSSAIITSMLTEPRCVLASNVVIVGDTLDQSHIDTAIRSKLNIEIEIEAMKKINRNIERSMVQTTIVLHEQNRHHIKQLNLNLFNDRSIYFNFFKCDVKFSR
ncbi:hypothetical protein [Sphingobacterium psychroaquaticum]|uniref:Uncharacterized protein n=1 Tax=Sphingobacterium psychroaquaticum TaxID=561061 RepID=A0A1X7JW51_9SPHI|nr:hypothetical protein [Sphingobacterium psychroaquaticum]SMG31944.1 hypothetical protein SAMN05660862_2225 [Sphingobacterium psychroaquaticum]